MFNLLAAEGGIGSTLPMILILGGLMIVMLLVSVIPQRKRRKQAQEMMSKIGKGDTIKTIGGFLGTIHAVDDTSFVINLATEESPILVNIDKAAVYTVVNSVNQPQQVVETPSGEKVVLEEAVKSIDDAEEDAKRAEKAKNKANKKTAKAVEVKGENLGVQDDVFENVDDVKN